MAESIDEEILAMRRKLTAALIAVAGLGAGASAAAHHSFAAEFDANAPIELTGTVTKIEWANPHTFFRPEMSFLSLDFCLIIHGFIFCSVG
jgi:hypothetical protein